MIQCELCEQRFSRAFTLKRHVASKHEHSGAEHRCEDCDELFARRDHLLRHQENVHGDGRKPCSKCSRTFRADYLRQHEQNCERKARLPGQQVVISTGSYRRRKKRSGSNEVAAQQATQMSAEPQQIDHRPDSIDDGRQPSVVPLGIIEKPVKIAESGSHAFGSEQDDICVRPKDVSAPFLRTATTKSSQPENVIYDKDGWTDFLPSDSNSYPSPPPFLIAAMEEMGRYAPELKLIAKMVDSLETPGFPYNGSISTHTRRLRPVIYCEDCDINYYVPSPKHVYWKLLNYHVRTPSHLGRMRTRLFSESSLVNELASVIIPDPLGKLEYVSQLVEGDVSIQEFAYAYSARSGQNIFQLAVDHDELEILAVFLDHMRNQDAYHYRGILLTADWANSLDRLGIAKIVAYREFNAKVLSRKTSFGGSLIDRWISSGRSAAAIELVEFTALQSEDEHEDALSLACSCGQDEIISALLSTRKAPFPDPVDHKRPLLRALEFASSKTFQKVLQAFAPEVSEDYHCLDELLWKLKSFSSKTGLRDFPDAAKKQQMLVQYIKHPSLLRWEYDDFVGRPRGMDF